MFVNLFVIIQAFIGNLLGNYMLLLYYITLWIPGTLSNWLVLRRQKKQWHKRMRKNPYNKRIFLDKKFALEKQLLWRQKFYRNFLKDPPSRPELLIAINPNYHRGVLLEATKLGVIVFLVVSADSLKKLKI